MSHHSIIYDLQSPAIGRWECNAPDGASCHAVFDCDCEEIYGYGVENGLPWHGDGSGETHVGRFDNDRCIYRDWYDNQEEDVHGTVRVDVTPVWEGDDYTFTATAARLEVEES